MIAGGVALTALRAVAGAMWATASAADLVVCANDGLAEIVREHVTKVPVEIVRNGVDESLLGMFDPAPPPPQDSIGVLYAGLLGHAQQLEVLIEAAALAPDLRVVLAGDGPCRGDLEHLVERRRLDERHVHRLRRPEELTGIYHSSDVLFAQVRKSRLHAVTAVPSKLYEYMAAGRPIVYAGEGAAAALIDETGSGITTGPGDPRAIVGAIRAAATSAGARMGERGRKYVSRASDARRRDASIRASRVRSRRAPDAPEPPTRRPGCRFGRTLLASATTMSSRKSHE